MLQGGPCLPPSPHSEHSSHRLKHSAVAMMHLLVQKPAVPDNHLNALASLSDSILALGSRAQHDHDMLLRTSCALFH